MKNFELLIDADELFKNLKNPNFRIIDTRFLLSNTTLGYKQYQLNHLPKAVYAHLDDDLSSNVTSKTGRHPLPKINALIDRIEGWGISNDSQVIIYDQSNGSIASRLWWMFRWLGHNKVAILNGGFNKWIENEHNVTNRKNGVRRGVFRYTKNNLGVLKTKDIEKNLISKSFVLFDARDNDRFLGINEPIDDKAGHIPNSVNLPFNKFLNKDGTWKSIKEIRKIWDNLDISNNTYGVMCGSGVTACHLIVSALIAGIPEPRLYAGSWSKWIIDPRHSIEKIT